MENRTGAERFASVELNYALRRIGKAGRDLMDAEGVGALLQRRKGILRKRIAVDGFLAVLGVLMSCNFWHSFEESSDASRLLMAVMLTVLLPVFGGGAVHGWCDQARVNRALRAMATQD